MGFTFDDTDKKHIASSLADMRGLIEKDETNSQRIFPYLGGEEVNKSPTQSHHRFVINFEDFPLRREDSGDSWYQLKEVARSEQLRAGLVAPDYPGPVAADWPDLLKIVEERVKPERDQDNREVRKREWWKYAERAPALAAALERTRTALCISRVSQHVAFPRVTDRVVAAETLVLLILEKDAEFSIVQSRVHEVWARIMAATLEDRFRYTPSDCFETFPFPIGYDSNVALEETGRIYYDFRAEMMVRNNEGLTKTYNRFHRPDDLSPDSVELRRLHDAIDYAVLDAYGWKDLQPVPDFFPEDETEEEAESEAPLKGGKSRKQPKYRYRWPDNIHDEVLARLLALNRERAALPSQAKDDDDDELGVSEESIESSASIDSGITPKVKKKANARSSTKKKTKQAELTAPFLF